MRLHVRRLIVLALAALLLGAFLYNVDVRSVWREIVDARPGWLAFALLTMLVSLVLRSWRWQYLFEPVGMPRFRNTFKATAVGFAASTVLPARAGEVIRPYFLARSEGRSATGAFATIIIERLLDMVTVVTLLAAWLFLFRSEVPPGGEARFEALQWAGGMAAVAALAGFCLLFIAAGDPARLGRMLARLGERLPSRLAGLLAHVAEKFAAGLGAMRHPGRLLLALGISLPLWLSIGFGIWAVAMAFHLAMPFTGSFLIIALLVVGVAVPTPGAVGGFHAAFRFGVTAFFGAPDDAAVGAAIVLHVLTISPTLLLGLWFAAQEGMNLSGMRQLADQPEPRSTV